jgi:hypothetical protein
LINSDPLVTILKKLEFWFFLHPEVFLHQIFDSWCGIVYTFSPAIQIIYPAHDPPYPQDHFSLFPSIFGPKTPTPSNGNSLRGGESALNKFFKCWKVLHLGSQNWLQTLIARLLLPAIQWISKVGSYGHLLAFFGLFQSSNVKIWLELMSQTVIPSTMSFGIPSKIPLRILNHLSELIYQL